MREGVGVRVCVRARACDRGFVRMCVCARVCLRVFATWIELISVISTTTTTCHRHGLLSPPLSPWQLFSNPYVHAVQGCSLVEKILVCSTVQVVVYVVVVVGWVVREEEEEEEEEEALLVTPWSGMSRAVY